jgi:hypothetical protein
MRIKDIETAFLTRMLDRKSRQYAYKRKVGKVKFSKVELEALLNEVVGLRDKVIEKIENKDYKK